jgi:mRNA interferase MazF
MDLKFGDVVLIEVRFRQALGAKIRPAIAVFDCGDEDFLAAPITSRARFGEYELSLAFWQAAGLHVPSIVRVHKIAVFAKTNIRRKLGTLSSDDAASLRSALCRAFCPGVK